MAKPPPPASAVKVICLNRKARHNYHIIETFEAGLVLDGGEIKSIRLGQITLDQSYIAPYGGELFLVGAHIKPYSFSSDKEIDPTRKRKLLLHKHEMDKLIGRVEQKGFTLIPLQIHLRRGRAKVELALAKGKDAPDKRADIKDREKRREAERAMKRES
ncbi:MAG: SsrA-binding protein SmpB [Oligoflexia bacterium]|nr:SsrA-binding protein SmpB [Oligoflexia bacterium]